MYSSMDSHLLTKIMFLLMMWITYSKGEISDFDDLVPSSISIKSESSDSSDSASSDLATSNLSVDEQLLESLEQKLVEQVIGNKMTKNDILPESPMAKFKLETSESSTETSSTAESTNTMDTDSRESDQQREKDMTTDDDMSLDSSEESKTKVVPDKGTSSAKPKSPTKSLFDHPRLQMPYQVSVDFDEGPLYPGRYLTQGYASVGKTDGRDNLPPVSSSYLSNGGIPRDTPLYYDEGELSSMSDEDSSSQTSEGTRRPNSYSIGSNRPGFTSTTLNPVDHSNSPSGILTHPSQLYGSPNGGIVNDNLYNDASRYRLTQGGYELYHPPAPPQMLNSLPVRVENGQVLPSYVPFSNPKPYAGFMPRPNIPLYPYSNRMPMGNFAYESDGGVYGYMQPMRSPQEDPNSLFRAFGEDLSKLMHRKKEEERIPKEKDPWDKIAPIYDEAEVENSKENADKSKNASTPDNSLPERGTVAPYENFIGFRKIQNSGFRPESWMLLGNGENGAGQFPENYLRPEGLDGRIQKLRKNYWLPYEQDRYIDSFDETSNELQPFGGHLSGNNNAELRSWLSRLYSNNAPSPHFYGNRGARLSNIDDSTVGTPACAQQNSSLCFEDPDYPRTEILYALDKEGFMLQRLLAPRDPKSVKKTDTMDSSEVEGRVCDADTIEGYPLRAINTLGQWKVILNFQDVETYKPFSQHVRIEKCQQPGQPCSFTKQEVETHCIQKFAHEHLVSWSMRKGLHMDVFELPIACTCQIKKQSSE